MATQPYRFLFLFLFLTFGFAIAATETPLQRIAFGSCLGQDLPMPVWKAVLEADPDLFIFLGDNVYADTHDMNALRSQYAKLAAQPGFQSLRSAIPILATWDDHDYGTNDTGADNPTRDQSQEIFLDFWQVPKDSPRRKQPGVYHSEVYGPPGQRVQIILLDTRYFRSPLKTEKTASDESYLPNEDANATLLGSAQWSWLEKQLQVPAQIRIIGSSIQVVAEDHGGEKWNNFPNERKKLFDLLWKSRATGLFFISGDMHFAELSMMNGDVGFPIYDLTSSSLNWSEKNWRTVSPNRHRIGVMQVGDNFGMIQIDWKLPDPLIRLQIRDELGDIMIQHKIPLTVLREGTWY